MADPATPAKPSFGLVRQSRAKLSPAFMSPPRARADAAVGQVSGVPSWLWWLALGGVAAFMGTARYRQVRAFADSVVQQLSGRARIVRARCSVTNATVSCDLAGRRVRVTLDCQEGLSLLRIRLDCLAPGCFLVGGPPVQTRAARRNRDFVPFHPPAGDPFATFWRRPGPRVPASGSAPCGGWGTDRASCAPLAAPRQNTPFLAGKTNGFAGYAS